MSLGLGPMDVRTIDAEVLNNDPDVLNISKHEIQRLFPVNSIRTVLLVTPPDGDHSMFDLVTAKRGRYWNYPPYGLGVLASHIRAEGIGVEILNLNNLILRQAQIAETADPAWFEEVLREGLGEAIATLKPDLIGVTCMFAQTHRSTLDVCHIIRDIEETAPIALGGVHITNSFMDEKTQASLINDFDIADFLFCYESEIAFRNFLRVINGDADLGDLTQVAFNRLQPRLYFSAKSIPTVDDMNVIPAHDLMEPQELNRNGKISGFYSLLPKQAKITTSLSNRGCRAQCTFCSVRNFNGIRVRRRSVQSVVDELSMLQNEFGIEHVMWLDDDFLYDREESLKLFNEMIRRDIHLTWDCTNGVIASSCTADVVRAAAESGCLGLTLGMESGNPEILRKIRKPGTVEIFLKAAEVLRGVEDINARVFLMIGFPGETYGQIMDTISVAREMSLDWYNVTALQPLPNTPIFDEMYASGLIGDIDFSDIRYNSGQYGKHRKMAEKSHDPLSVDFKNAFAHADQNLVPTRAELDEIWAYMNYHLNFKRLFFEQRPKKLRQQLAYVENIASLVAPDNAFATYFTGYLSYKVRGQIEPEIVSQLEATLARSDYWHQRSNDFLLLPDDLRNLDFSRHLEQGTSAG